MAMATSSCLSLATAHVHLNAMPPSVSVEPMVGVAAWAKSTSCSRPACSMEVSYSSSAIIPVLSMNKKKIFRLLANSSTITEEGMSLAATEEQVEEEVHGFSEAESAEEEEEFVSAPAPGTKVYVGNLPYSCDSAELAGIVQQHGSAEMVEVIYDRNSGRSRGFAFVTMSTVEDANALIENLDGSDYGGRTLRVNFPGSQRTNRERTNNNFVTSEHQVFVGNLAWGVNADTLSEVFRECGNILGAKVLYDDTGRSRGFGFVSFSSQSEVEAAVASLNGMELEGRAIRVDVAMGRRNS
uniref:TSA: Wollemia nobilis Ref_Wollemi_Transcript_4546_1138 transcribed RNA sequence n=1 Tax=Wollemia nobilis TaxID=56998 RepID=A0A0C9QW54_9CONI